VVVYFIKRQSDGAIKIGYTGCMKTRLNRIQCNAKTDIDILCVIDGGRPIEHLFHKQFEAFRLEGEWFSPGTELLEYIDSMQNNCLETKNVLEEGKIRNVLLRMRKPLFLEHKTAKGEQSWEEYFEVERVRK
jgi:hypothetical protein